MAEEPTPPEKKPDTPESSPTPEEPTTPPPSGTETPPPSPSQSETPPPSPAASDTPPPADAAGSMPPPAGETPPPPAAGAPAAGLDDRMACILAHALGIVTSFVGPLIIWLLKKDESQKVAVESKEALNFQITVAIAYVVGMVLQVIPIIGTCLGLLLMAAAWICTLIFGIMGAVAASENRPYVYPWRLVLIK